MKLNIYLCTFSICVLQYSAEQKGNFMLKIYSIKPVLFIRMKDWRRTHFQMLYWDQGYTHASGRAYMTGLGCRLTNLTTSSPYSGRLTLHVLGQGLDHSIQVHVLIYPVEANRFGVWLHTLSRMNFSWLCSRPTSVPYCSPGSASLTGLVLLSPPMLGLLRPCVGSFPGVPRVTPPLPAFSRNSSQQHSPEAKAFTENYPSIVFYPSFTKRQCGERSQSRESNNTSQEL